MNGIYNTGDVVLEEWTLTKMLGQGSYGKVFEGQRTDFGQTYRAAIKIITIPQSQNEIQSARAEGLDDENIRAYFQSLVESMVQEFGIMAKLKGNSNIVSYEDHRVIPHSQGIGWDIVIRMEQLTPMLDYMNGHPFSQKDVVKVAIDMCKALELCRKFEIIHRDIKPENMFVSDLGDFKLGDFGIARTIEKNTSNMSKKGTYTYMAPEIYKEEPYDFTADIYSLGIVLYRLLNNNRAPLLPLTGPITHSQREEALFRRIAGAPLPLPVNASGALAEAVLKACAYKPCDRWQSPTAMREVFEELYFNMNDDGTEKHPNGASAGIRANSEDDEGTVSAPYRHVPAVEDDEDESTISVAVNRNRNYPMNPAQPGFSSPEKAEHSVLQPVTKPETPERKETEGIPSFAATGGFAAPSAKSEVKEKQEAKSLAASPNQNASSKKELSKSGEGVRISKSLIIGITVTFVVVLALVIVILTGKSGKNEHIPEPTPAVTETPIIDTPVPATPVTVPTTPEPTSEAQSSAENYVDSNWDDDSPIFEEYRPQG